MSRMGDFEIGNLALFAARSLLGFGAGCDTMYVQHWVRAMSLTVERVGWRVAGGIRKNAAVADSVALFFRVDSQDELPAVAEWICAELWRVPRSRIV